MSDISLSPDSQTSARHTCHCGKAFLRKEHLRRHKATHGQLSFVCHICNRSFSRNDILRKHIAVHDASQIPMPKGRMACDGCHRNKIRCDWSGGGCSSCARRNLECTFSRTHTSSNKAADGVLDSSPSSSSHTGVGSDVRSGQVERLSVGGEALVLPPSHLPSTPHRQHLDMAKQAEYDGLRYTTACISAAMIGDMARLRSLTAPEHVKSWQKLRTSTYIAGFHERWPVIHAPTIDAESDDPLVVGTVMMISAWDQDDEIMRRMILLIHERFTTYVQQKLLSLDETSHHNAMWPFELYTVALLNVIFAFEAGIAKHISRARNVLALLVSAFRERRILSAEVVEVHEATHHPGNFRPWIHQHRDKWKWLILSMVKIDAYMALLCNQPPTILVDELELGLTATFALSNAYGIDKFFAREPQDPVDRASCTMASMARSPDTVLMSGTLIEDAWLGLCGTFAEIWNCNQLLRIQRDAVNVQEYTRQHAASLHRLSGWKSRIEDIADLATESVRETEAAKRLLLAYRGEEDTYTPEWEGIVRSRIATYVSNARLFYHLLGLHCTADVKSITVVALGSWSITGSPTAKPDATAEYRIGQWAVTSDARTAVLHALHVLLIHETSSEVLAPQSTDAVGLVALCTAGIVFHCWIESGNCSCVEGTARDLCLDVASEENEWVRDGGVAVVGATPLCVCSSATWMARFANALRQRGRGWGMTADLVQKWLSI